MSFLKGIAEMTGRSSNADRRLAHEFASCLGVDNAQEVRLVLNKRPSDHGLALARSAAIRNLSARARFLISRAWLKRREPQWFIAN